jgi:hypothetical protein
MTRKGYMRITRKVKLEIEEEVVDDILCNKCGETCFDKYERNFEGLIEAHLCGGYGSKIGDSLEVEFSLCETCLLELFDRCVIKPKFIDIFGGDYEEQEETETVEETNSAVPDNAEGNS